MKKIFIILSCFMVVPVFAGFITETTQLQWNSKVIETALNNAGFTGSDDANWDVRTTRNRILEDLLARQKFSVLEAISACKAQCNKSDFLRNGRGKSGKKCPELCENFANNIIKVNNDFDTNIPGVGGATSDEFSDLQGKAVDVCRKLMSDATKNGISYPVLCGGACAYFGQDKVQITDLSKTKEYEVNDFCDNDESGREYFYVLSDEKNALDVSRGSEGYRVKKLKEVQSKPAGDYVKKQVEKTKKDKESAYAKRVEKNGYCKEVSSGNGEASFANYVDKCKRPARAYAQRNACKLKTYASVFCPTGGDYGIVECFVNSYEKDILTYSPVLEAFFDDNLACGGGTFVTNYEYTPSYKDCVATFNEKDCD